IARAELEDTTVPARVATVPARVAGLIQSEPDVALDGLLGWLIDDAKLHEGEAVVADVAAAFLFHHRDLFFDRLCDALVISPHENAHSLLRALVHREPDRFIATLERWSDAPGPPDRLILEWAGDVCSPALEAAIAPILQRLHHRAPDS